MFSLTLSAGIQIDEPAADLAVAAAIASSWKDISIRADAVLIGEIGLAGELRMPGQMQTRLREASKLGFKCAIVPKAIYKGEGWPTGIEIIERVPSRKPWTRHLPFKENCQRAEELHNIRATI